LRYKTVVGLDDGHPRFFNTPTKTQYPHALPPVNTSNGIGFPIAALAFDALATPDNRAQAAFSAVATIGIQWLDSTHERNLRHLPFAYARSAGMPLHWTGQRIRPQCRT
jgi:hypothetical protein